MGEEKTPLEDPGNLVVTKDTPEIASKPPAVPAGENHAATDESKALVLVENLETCLEVSVSSIPILGEEKTEAIVESSVAAKSSDGGSIDRDAVLAKVNTEKRVALIKAWEESEKAKAENKYNKKVASVGAWENSKKAAREAELRKAEEKLEKKKAAYVENMKNKIATIHKKAEEKKAMAEAKYGEEVLKAEESAAKFRASGQLPKKFLLCFGG